MKVKDKKVKDKKDVLEYVDYIRQHKQCSGLYTPNYTHKQRDQGGKHVRGNIACLLLYPQDDTHYECIKKLYACAYNFAGCIHDRDMKPQNDIIEINFDDTTTVEENLEEVTEDVTEELTSEDVLDELDTYANENRSLRGEQFKGEHIHIVILFSSRKTNTAVAKELGISSNYVRMFSSKPILKQKLLYLIHRDDKSKYQYSPEDVFGTSLVFDFTEFLADTDVSNKEQRDKILDYIKRHGRNNYIVKNDFIAYCNDNGLYGFVCGSNWSLFNNLINESNQIYYYNITHPDNKFDARSKVSKDDFCIATTCGTEKKLDRINEKLTNILEHLQFND